MKTEHLDALTKNMVPWPEDEFGPIKECIDLGLVKDFKRGIVVITDVGAWVWPDDLEALRKKWGDRKDPT